MQAYGRLMYTRDQKEVSTRPPPKHTDGAGTSAEAVVINTFVAVLCVLYLASLYNSTRFLPFLRQRWKSSKLLSVALSCYRTLHRNKDDRWREHPVTRTSRCAKKKVVKTSKTVLRSQGLLRCRKSRHLAGSRHIICKSWVPMTHSRLLWPFHSALEAQSPADEPVMTTRVSQI